MQRIHCKTQTAAAALESQSDDVVFVLPTEEPELRHIHRLPCSPPAPVHVQTSKLVSSVSTST